MKTRIFLALLASAALFGLPAHAAGVSAAPAKPDDRVEVRGNTLQLNGTGVRSRDGQGIYNAALYLKERTSNAAAVLAAPGSKRLSLTMLRDVSAEELGKLFTHRIKDNTDKATLSKIVPGLIHMGQIFSQHHKLKVGETVTIDWLPGNSIQISVKGQPQGEPFQDAEFSAALMKIWLGDAPADGQLKDALLGKKG
jgi:NAD-specific glutamate dehydrogenase